MVYNSPKKKIENQKYEDYWKITLAHTDFFCNKNDDFIKELRVVIDHIDKYDLSNKDDSELIKDLSKKKKQFNNEIVHEDELQNNLKLVLPNDQEDGASTRKQINELIKLGFIKPYLKGYVKFAKEYIKPGQSKEKLKQLFSDTVYQYSSFDSSQTNDDTENNQIKYFVNTLLNRNKNNRKLTYDEIIGLMLVNNIKNKGYANEKIIKSNKEFAKLIDFKDRKYNQISHFISILKKLEFLKCSPRGTKKEDFICCLTEDGKELIPETGKTERDRYRFAIMKKAVFEESKEIYGKKLCWLTKQETRGLVVSHIYKSADALKKYDYDSAYDPNNALLLAPGNPDQFFDKYDMTIDQKGNPVFKINEKSKFKSIVLNSGFHIDKEILNESRLEYLLIHNEKFKESER